MPRNKVQIEFSDPNEAIEFKKEMEDRFGIEKISKYQVASGTGKHGGRVYVERTEDKENNNMNKLDETRAKNLDDFSPRMIQGIISDHFMCPMFSKPNGNGYMHTKFEIMPGTEVYVEINLNDTYPYYRMFTRGREHEEEWIGLSNNEFAEDLEDLKSFYA